MADYLPLLLLGILAFLFGAVSFVASRILVPPRPTPAKTAPYECGIVSGREPPERFPVRFYLVAMIFIMFDVEIIFLFPWAVEGRNLGAFAFYEVLVFSTVFFAAFIYLIARGGLEWGPRKQVERFDVTTVPNVTPAQVRRVGLEGREFAPRTTTPGEAA